MPDDHPLNAAFAMVRQGRLDDAGRIALQVLQRDSRSAGTMHLLGIISLRRGQAKEGLRWMEKAASADPKSADCQNGLGVLLGASGRHEEAAGAFEQAISLRGDFAEAHSNLGTALINLSRFEAAEQAIRRAIRFDPTHGEAYFNIGNLLRKTKRVGQAIMAYRDAIRVKPNYRPPVGNLAIALLRTGDAKEAAETYRRWLNKHPNDLEIYSNLLYVLHYLPDVGPKELFDEHLAWARLGIANFSVKTPAGLGEPASDRPLRIGYISGDFREHPRARFIEPILAGHDRRQFQIFCYSTAKRHDAVTDRLKPLADVWRDVTALADEKLVAAIRADKIDILIDCTGHMAGSKLAALAQKPARIQVHYPGYPNTTGTKAFDYLLTDAWQDPPGASEHLYTEKLVRLANYPRCYSPTHEVDVPPAIARDHVVFGAFNNVAKNSDATLQTWKELLDAVAGSRLVVLCAPGTESLLRNRYVQRGLPDAQMDFVTSRPRRQYLELLAGIDVLLDPFPYNGYTTTLDALWMGVPVITLEGASHVSRAGVSILNNAGHPELIAKTTPEYVSIAAALAGDRARLHSLRTNLREQMQRSPLMDAGGLVTSLEAAYRSMWRDAHGAHVT